MNNQVLVWDLETVPDLQCVSRVHGLEEDDAEGARAAIGEKMPRLPFCQIVCVGALRVERTAAIEHRPLPICGATNGCVIRALEEERVFSGGPRGAPGRSGLPLIREACA